MHHFQSEAVDRLFDAVLSLKDREECYNFFEDVCTIKEVQDMSQRLEAACLLARGESYQRISEETGVSAATIRKAVRAENTFSVSAKPPISCSTAIAPIQAAKGILTADN